MKFSTVAFIPARSGSKRIPHKNIKILGGHPMLAYSIISAIESGIFDTVICATDDEKYAEIAQYYGAEVPFLRSKEIAGDKSPDIEWLFWILSTLKEAGRTFDIFSILRPTNPFRQASTIRRAWDHFINDPQIDSIRAVEKCKQHPGKMWKISGDRMTPLFPFEVDGTPWHSSQYANLPEVYIQNASLEISWVKNALEKKLISGNIVKPFISNGLEGFDVNDPEDFELSKIYIANNSGILPEIKIKPFKL
jgi:N-acylneuraminate cytidylyltransferase